MNMGTVRYHVFILGMNHKITVFNDGKFVRYFPNSNFYSKEEQLVIAIMRREAYRRMIDALMDIPAATNVELSQRLGQPDSAVSKMLKELCAKGITVKGTGQGERPLYSLDSRYREMIPRLSQRLNSE
ncbi:MAG: winged helix-turn-helix transcriptional regulator, partial [Methanocella sp.]